MSRIPMRRYEKLIKDPAIIAAILDMCNTVYVGMFDAEYPYVLPLNFAYEISEQKLYIYLHGAREGHKIELWNKNPKVSATFSVFFNYPDRPYKDTIHDFRSVMARGILSRIDKKTDPDRYRRAFRSILQQNERELNDFSARHASFMDIYMIECPWDYVTGKSEHPVRSVADVPFPDVYDLPVNEEPHDKTDLLTRKIDDL